MAIKMTPTRQKPSATSHVIDGKTLSTLMAGVEIRRPTRLATRGDAGESDSAGAFAEAGQ